MTKTTISVLILSMLLLSLTYKYTCEIEKKIASYEYSGNQGKTQFTSNMKIIGGKRFGTSILWLKQVLDIGGQMGDHDDVEEVTDKAELIKQNADAITYLDPYFLGNYYFSAPIVAMIRTINRPDIGLAILDKGIEYNPDDSLIKFYFAGIIAYQKKDAAGLLAQFEKIIEKYRDDMITDVVAFVYEEKYKATNDIKYLAKAYYYRIMLLDSKDVKYRSEAEKKVEEFGEKLKLDRLDMIKKLGH